MSTSNNQYGQEIRPIWRDGEELNRKLHKLSTDRLVKEGRVSNLTECTSVSFESREIAQIADLAHLANVRRLNLSKNQIKRLFGLSSLKCLSLLNVSSNDLQHPHSLDDLQFCSELRTLNICRNPKLTGIKSDAAKVLGATLQCLIANDIGLKSISDIRIFNFRCLNTLVLSHNSLTEWDNTIELPLLEKLTLSYNALSRVPELKQSVLLQELRLNSNQINTASVVQSVLFSSASSKKNLKTLDLSNNKIDDWSAVQRLASELGSLTNLGLKANPLPPPTDQILAVKLREDLASDSIESPADKNYRHAVLVMFQKQLGKEKKFFVQLLVLDSKRVKVKWSQGGSSRSHEIKTSSLTKDNNMEVKLKSIEAPKADNPKTKEKNKRKRDEALQVEATSKIPDSLQQPPVLNDYPIIANDSGLVKVQKFGLGPRVDSDDQGNKSVFLSKSVAVLDQW